MKDPIDLLKAPLVPEPPETELSRLTVEMGRQKERIALLEEALLEDGSLTDNLRSRIETGRSVP